MRRPLREEPRGVLEDVLRDVDELLEEPGAETRVTSEEDLRRLVRVTGRPRVVLVNEMAQAETRRAASGGRAYEPPPTLGTLLRLARREVAIALRENEEGQ